MFVPFVFAALWLTVNAVEPASAASPEPAPVATPREVLREIGRVKAVTPFCHAFAEHFNASARALLTNDQTLTFVDFTLGSLESHFKAHGGELLLYDDRVKLMKFNESIFKSIAALQAEIDALRRAAALTTDPEAAKEDREVATQLQKALDKQRQLAGDTQGVIQALTERALGTTEFPVNVTHGDASQGLPLSSGPSAATNYQGSVSDNQLKSNTTPQSERDVRTYLQFNKQLDRIGDAESAAVTAAENVAKGC